MYLSYNYNKVSITEQTKAAANEGRNDTKSETITSVKNVKKRKLF